MSSPGRRNISPTKSRSPSKINMREQSSSRVIRGRVSESTLQQISKRKENLLHCFDIYELLFQNNVPQRCMAHNNFVTLYCENQHRLLCVNCIYGNSSHINHKVIPIKNAFKKIQDDNNIMKKQLRQYIQDIKVFERNTLSAREQAEATLKNIMHELQDQYSQALSALQDKFMKMKEGIINMFRNDSSRMDYLANQIDWFKQTYIQRQKALPTSGQQSPLLFSHMMLNLMLQNDSLRQNKVEIIDIQEMKNNTVNEFKRIFQGITNPTSSTKKRIF